MSRPRLIFLHGSVLAAEATWAAQAPLAERFELELVTRPGYPPGPPLEQIDFEAVADGLAASLRPGDHLVGLSYGGIYALAVAGRRPDVLASLTVIEPPAFGLVREHPSAREIIARVGRLRRERPEPAAYLRRFFAALGEDPDALPDPMPPELAQGVRAATAEPPPWEVTLPLEALAAAQFPILAVSGGWSDAFETVCDALAERIAAERTVLPGARHYVPSLGAPFNDLLTVFVERALR